MRYLLSILLICFASCTEPLITEQSICIEYHIGNSYTTSTVRFVDGLLVCDKWQLSVTSTPDNQTRLFRDTTVQTNIGEVYQSSTFLFPNNQSGDTLRGIYISHSRGSVCNTYDTLPVWAVRVPCKDAPEGGN